MAKLFLLALGSRGDVQPFVALAAGLRDAGHDVILATPAGFEDIAGGRGFTHVEVMGRADSLLEDPGHDLVKTALRHPVREFRRLLGIWFSRMDEAMEALPTASAGADAVLWWEPFGMLGRHLAQALGIPGVAAGLNPNWTSSTIPEPSLPWPPKWLPDAWRARYVRLGHALTRQWTTALNHRRINRWRRDTLGLAGLPWRAGAADRVARPVLRLSPVSPLVRDLPPEWKGSVIATGHWVLPADEEWAMPEDLRAFLDTGPPPIFTSMGVVPSFPSSLGPAMLEAARRAGVRLVLGVGWNGRGGLDTAHLPPDVIAVGDIDYERVFPFMAGVIHHGGGGSTAAALRSGVPSLGLPSIADQPYWARRIAALGVGPDPLPARRAGVDELATAMRRMRDDEAMRRRAAELGRRLREEDGVREAVDVIERLLSSP